ncbi:LysR family transcriptional regulator [Breoghania corrubedonensis]|uniref:LysR family transcriptional regulator n=1 Tax=Breoghania corrubedonensis TaxID=665038 RepID=A0A2T5VIF4_9HYPH|nr:LysR family transcriptional regulator [Breoghania corrubedonensis]PTW63549.1 LysR family transcriptional regulator [Breoghania corrubedonensis]
MDQLTRMRCFIQVVDAGGFSAAARAMGRSKALVSKYVGELEDELGVRLLNRTTRQISTTEAGQAYYREASDILQRIDDLQEAMQDAHQRARGLLRISASRAFGDHDLSRAVMGFLSQNPDISVDLKLEDRFVDLVEEGFDVAIRLTELSDSSLIARKLAPFRQVTVAAPEFIAIHSRPEEPGDLADIPCVVDTNYRFRSNLVFRDGEGGRRSVAIKGRVEVNSAEAARQAALAGLGFARTPLFMVRDDIAAGRLERVLEEYESDDAAIWVVYPHRKHLSGKVRAFVDFLVSWFEREALRGAF